MVFKSFKVVTFEQVLGFEDGDSEGNWIGNPLRNYTTSFHQKLRNFLSMKILINHDSKKADLIKDKF